MTSMMMARTAVAALVAAGVRDVVICPGSRSAPLVYALDEYRAQGEGDANNAAPLRIHPHIDERSAGFLALGLARGSERPVAVITTSGTAPAHLYPAVIEAAHSGVTLVVVSADRPAEMRGVGASQATTQPGMFAPHVRHLLDVPAGDAPDVCRRSGDLIRRTVVNAHRHRQPAHINVAFRDPLVPHSDSASESQPVSQMMSEPGAARICVEDRREESGRPTPWSHVVDPQRRTLIVAGDRTDEIVGEAQLEQLGKTGLPVCAEPSSGLHRLANWAPAQQQMLTGAADEVEQVIVYATPTLSRPVSALLAREDVRVVVVSKRDDYPDVAARANVIVDAIDWTGFTTGDAIRTWAGEWLRRARQCIAILSDRVARGDVPHGVVVASQVWEAFLGGGHDLVLGASNAIRYVDLVAGDTTQSGGVSRQPKVVRWQRGEGACGEDRVWSNRGQAGIDGTIAFARGIARSRQRPVRVLLGDVTFAHDVGSLMIGRESVATGMEEPPVHLVILDDAGGRIFASLEHGYAASPELFERLFAVGHDLDIESLAGGFHWGYSEFTMRDPHGCDALHSRLACAWETDEITRVLCDHRAIRQGLRDVVLGEC